MTSLQNLIQVLPDEVPALTASSGMSSFRMKFCWTISSCDKRMIGSNLRAAYPSCPDPLASSLVTRDWKYDLSNYIFLLKNSPPSNTHPVYALFPTRLPTKTTLRRRTNPTLKLQVKKIARIGPPQFFSSSTFNRTYLPCHFNCSKTSSNFIYLHLNFIRLTCHSECPWRYGGRLGRRQEWILITKTGVLLLLIVGRPFH